MMLEFTNHINPDRKVYIDPKCIQAISPAPVGDASEILVSGQWLAVKESPEQVREKMVANQ